MTEKWVYREEKRGRLVTKERNGGQGGGGGVETTSSGLVLHVCVQLRSVKLYQWTGEMINGSFSYSVYLKKEKLTS